MPIFFVLSHFSSLSSFFTYPSSVRVNREDGFEAGLCLRVGPILHVCLLALVLSHRFVSSVFLFPFVFICISFPRISSSLCRIESNHEAAPCFFIVVGRLALDAYPCARACAHQQQLRQCRRGGLVFPTYSSSFDSPHSQATTRLLRSPDIFSLQHHVCCFWPFPGPSSCLILRVRLKLCLGLQIDAPYRLGRLQEEDRK